MMRPIAVLCLAVCASAARAQDRTMPPDAERQLARAIYKEMIEIKSGYTTGATTPVANAVAKRLKAAGFPAADIFVGGASPTKANLVVRYRGTGRKRPILLLAHTDVVEAKLHAEGVIVDSRPGRIRLSPHWCVTEEELERGMDLVLQHLGASARTHQAAG